MLKKRKRFLFTICFCAFAITFSCAQNTFNFSVENQTIPETLRQLSEASQTNIAFSERFFFEEKKVSFSSKNTSLKEVLNEILKDQSVEFRFVRNRVIISKKAIENFTISGYLSDASSGERLIYANIFTNLGTGTTTNEYGFFSLTLPAGEVKLTMSYIGFAEAKKEVVLNQNISINQSLSPSLTLMEVVVTPENIKNLEPLPTGLSSKNISIETLNAIPDIGGEADLVRAIGLLPGVQNGTDGLGGMHVRGGGADQNLMLLDGVPIYHSGHLLNMFSVYNSQAIKSARFLKSGFPARYGGRLSSVLDVRTKEGNLQQFSGDAEVGLLSGKGTLEGPFKKDKGAFLVSGRGSLWQYTVGDLLAPIINDTADEIEEGEKKETEINFFDLNAKLNYDFGRDRLYLSYYIGRDVFKNEIYTQEDELRETDEARGSWGNQIFALRWNRQFSGKTFANTTLTYSNYNFSYQQLFEEFDDKTYSFFAQSSDIRDLSLNTDFDYHISPNCQWKFGGGAIFHALTPEDFYIDDETDESDENEDFEVADFQDELSFAETLFSGEFFAYAENEIHLPSKTNLALGLRLSSFFSDEVAAVHPEPRFFISQNLGQNIWLTASASRMIQYLHRATTSNLNLPDSKWIPTSEEHPEEISWQETLGVEFSPAKNWIFSTEGYYKNFKNQVLFPLSVSTEIADSSYLGRGTGYGIEAMLEKIGRTGGNINYTWSKANRQYEGYNSNRIFPFQFDQRHNVKLHLYHKFNSKLRADLTWTYATANPIVLLIDSEADDPEMSMQQSVALLTERGEPNHSLNFGLKYAILKGDFLHQIKLGVYNAYNRKNTHFSRLESDGKLEATSLFGVLPALSYRLRFR